MNRFIYPTADSTIYSLKTIQLLNFGKSEILELKSGFSVQHGLDVSRILIKFDIPFNKQNYTDFSDLKFLLSLKITNAPEVTDSTRIDIYPVTDVWDEGVGIGYDANPAHVPVNWLYKTQDTLWEVDEQSDVEGGGNYYTHVKRCNTPTTTFDCKYVMEQKTSDVKVDVTDIVKCWILDDIPNNGFLLKLSNDTLDNLGTSVKFYSKDTNTIYSPVLVASYDDYSFGGTMPCVVETTNLSGTLSGTLDTDGEPELELEPESEDDFNFEKVVQGSCEQLTDPPVSDTSEICLDKVEGDIHVAIRKIKKVYRPVETARFDVSVRPKTPIKTFSKKAKYSGNNYTDYDMYYSIRDAETHEIVVEFNKYSKVSCDSSGHFFNFDFGVCQPGRYYKIFILLNGPYGDEVFDESRIFNVEI